MNEAERGKDGREGIRLMYGLKERGYWKGARMGWRWRDIRYRTREVVGPVKQKEG